MIEHNPDSIFFPWVIADDNSDQETLDYISYLDRDLHPMVVSMGSDRRGITKTMQALVAFAKTYGDILLYLQNDWETTRRIDFNAIQSFYNMHPNAGHIRAVQYKGNDRSRPVSKFNLATGEEIVKGQIIEVGNEKFIAGNWHYSDIPGLTRMEYAVKMFRPRPECNDQEQTRIFNIHSMGCDNYLLEDQPFRNMDYDRTRQTPGGRPK